MTCTNNLIMIRFYFNLRDLNCLNQLTRILFANHYLYEILHCEYSLRNAEIALKSNFN